MAIVIPFYYKAFSKLFAVLRQLYFRYFLAFYSFSSAINHLIRHKIARRKKTAKDLRNGERQEFARRGGTFGAWDTLSEGEKKRLCRGWTRRKPR